MPKIVKDNWDISMRVDMMRGVGFRITEPPKVKEIRTYNGIFSSRFATDFSDDDAFMDLYICKCESLRGKKFKDEVCPICGTTVKFTETKMEMTGWIILDKDKFIHPIYYKKLESALSKDVLNEIILFEKDYTNIRKRSSVKHPFVGIGIIGLREHFDDILNFFKDRARGRKYSDLFEELISEKECVFQSCIPVFNKVLRPTESLNEKFRYASANKKYMTLFNISVKINDAAKDPVYTKRREGILQRRKEDRQKKLYRYQMKLLELWDIVFVEIDQKFGQIKGSILGGRVDCTARNVIVPDPTLKTNEVDLPYLTVLELYKYELIGMISDLYGVSDEAYSIWYMAAIRFDPVIFDLMQHFISKKSRWVNITRNPTINLGSQFTMKIRKVKAENDYTMSLPTRILTSMNADFDGDTLTILALKIKRMEKEYKRFLNPRDSFYISRDNGLFNSAFNLYKDEVIGLFDFLNI